MRKIIHIDMDAFFASVEQRDNPALRGKPLIVGGDPNGRGVVSTASYEARQFGIRSAMSCYEAKKRCPHAIFVRPRFDAYRDVSTQVHAIMRKLAPIVEPLSLDEAYLDVTDVDLYQGSATLMANYLRQTIYDTTGLTASAGVSYNKMLAKIASDINKPNGITIITPEHAQSLVDSLPIEQFHGIGKSSSAKLHDLGIHTGLALRKTEVSTLVGLFGQKRGQYYHDIAHGIDHRPVQAERIRKSIGTEVTFGENVSHDEIILAKIQEQTSDAFAELTKRTLTAHTITLKIKYADFSQITRSHTHKQPFESAEQAYQWAVQLFHQADHTLAIRLVGITFSNFGNNQGASQPSLFDIFE